MDNELLDEPAPGAPGDAAGARRRAAPNADELWTVITPAHPQRPPGLYTFVELTRDEQRQVRDGALDLGAQLADAVARVEPIIDALAAQYRRFFDEELPAFLREAVEQRLDELDQLDAVDRSLGFPPGWKASVPALQTDLAVASAEEDEEAHRAATGQGGAVGEETEAAPVRVVGFPTAGRTRLDNASFEDLLRTVRVWADAVGRHPQAYRGLVEDRISDLLVASLNASMPGAYREVFSRGGKTDLFVAADALPGGQSPARVFVGECKKRGGQPAVADGAMTQLLNYLDRHATSALLVLLVEARFDQAQNEVIDHLLARTDCRRRKTEPVEGWPVLQVTRAGREVGVCVATIDIT